VISDTSDDVLKVNNCLHILNCTLTSKTNTMTLDKVTDKRNELFNACLNKLMTLIMAQNYQVEQMSECEGTMPILKFLINDIDHNNMNLVQNSLALITNLIDGLIKPEDASVVNLDLFLRLLEHVSSVNAVNNSYIINN